MFDPCITHHGFNQNGTCMVDRMPNVKKTEARAAKKSASRKQPATKDKTAVPLKPVTPKIGETAGNLQKRAESFSRRRGKT